MNGNDLCHSCETREATQYGLSLTRSKKYGRTVVAENWIFKGLIFLVEPVLIMPNDDCVGIVSSYSYVWDKKHSAMVLGFGSLFNHSYTPNAKYIQDIKNGRMKFKAIKDIQAGDEIFINYNGDPTDTSPVWFKVK